MIESEDFDFEANLAMFDKEREMQVTLASHWSIYTITPLIGQEIETDLMSNKPDIVRLVHSNVRQPEPKYRTDENVLGEKIPNFLLRESQVMTYYPSFFDSDRSPRSHFVCP